jgi:hypothetical protein
MGMIPTSEFDRLRSVILNGLTNMDFLTDFDRQFLLDYHTKFDKYKRHTFVSDGQEAQFDRIEAYLQDELGSDYVRADPS